MKRIFMVTMLCAACVTLPAQQIEIERPTADDYVQLLERSGYQLFKRDISSFDNDTWNIKVVVKEFVDGKETDFEDMHVVISNRVMVADFDEETRALIQEKDFYDSERGIYMCSNALTVGFVPTLADSVQQIYISVDGMGSFGRWLNLRPLSTDDGGSSYNYGVRPFKQCEFAEGKFIPLVLLGSYWADGAGMRFCGESEIEPDMSSEILSKIPHYYVIGVEFRK